MTKLKNALTRRAFVAAGAAGASALALAGCSGTDGDGADAGSAAGATTKVTLCLDYTPNTNHTGIYVAEAKGYFADEGLEVEIVQPADDGSEAIIGTGQAEFGVTYQDYMANAFVAGNTGLVAVAAVIQHNTSGIMSREEDGIVSAKNMEGHTYGTWDLPVETATVKRVVEADGGDFSKVQTVPLTTDDEVSGLRANLFDCVWVYEGWAVQNAAVQDYPVNYFSFIGIDDVFDYYTPVIAANVEYAEANPEVVKAFLRAVRKGYEFAVDDPDAAAQILCEAVPELDAELVAQSQRYLAGEYISDAESWGVIDGDRWSAFYQWLNDEGLLEAELDVDAGWTMDYLS